MAKFKKKKSKPTPESNDSKEPVKEESLDIPETEKIEPSSENSPSDSSINEAEKNRKLNKLFWMRVSLAVIAGSAATFIFEDIEGEDKRWASIGFMIIIFFATIIIAKEMKMQLPPSDRKKIVTQGIGSYVFMYLFIWIITYTLVNVGNVSSGIPTPFS